jgi:hypothetical protein
MYQITRADKEKKTRKILHSTPDGHTLLYLDIRAGIAWPYRSAPAYFCIFGQKGQKNAFKKHPLVFMAEAESEDLRALLQKLGDECSRLLCGDVYADFEEERQSYRGAISHAWADRKAMETSITQAPHARNFQYGTDMIREWVQDKALEIPSGTILSRQLGNLPKPETWEDPEEQFYAVNALRYVLGSAKDYSWTPAELPPIDFGDWSRYPGCRF